MLPNVFKVIIILEELKLPYTLEPVDMGDIKKEPYISLNPNGRLPSMKDPNTGIILWEVGSRVSQLVILIPSILTLFETVRCYH
jgi:glutathione S-transferase